NRRLTMSTKFITTSISFGSDTVESAHDGRRWHILHEHGGARACETLQLPATSATLLNPPLSRLMTQELHLADVSGVIFSDDQVTVKIHRNLPDFADLRRRWIVEPFAVPGMRGKVAVEKKMDVATAIDIPNLAAA